MSKIEMSLREGDAVIVLHADGTVDAVVPFQDKAEWEGNVNFALALVAKIRSEDEKWEEELRNWSKDEEKSLQYCGNATFYSSDAFLGKNQKTVN